MHFLTGLLAMLMKLLGTAPHPVALRPIPVRTRSAQRRTPE